MKRIQSLCRMALLLLMLLSALIVPMFADEPEQLGRLTIESRCSGSPVAGAAYSLYYVGSISGSTVTLTESFAASPLDPASMVPSKWDPMAMTIRSYALDHAIDPVHTGLTDEAGTLTFADLTPGLYLISDTNLSTEEATFTSPPFFVALPYYVASQDAFCYERTVRPKVACTEKPTEECKVLKIWQDKDKEAERPAEITIRLYQDDALYETVTLSAENDWRYHWEKLPADHAWHVYEEPVENYTTEIQQEGITFTVTNTRRDDPSDPDPIPPPIDEKPTDLPHTGLYWWPVVVLVVAGLVCLLLGALKKRKLIHEEKAE